MTELDVDGIRFTFDDRWSALKWDDSDAYKLHIGKLQEKEHGTKAVDIVGLCERTPYLFEIKDFRGRTTAIANRDRDLSLEIGFKVRDTAAGLLGAVSRRSHGLPADWLAAVTHNAVHVVAWIAEDAARLGETEHKRKARRSTQGASIAQRLAWLTERRAVRVEDPLRELSVPGVTARSLAGAGPARP
ncbi:MAG TPA: hypothetical protein VFX59_04050 [Polyangiales bacterium]|nr:hypothetical protein [Polyangiales bacterium]